jgi:hypothetical protein
MKTKFLKHSTLILVLFTGLIFTGCKKDKKASDDLVGTWTVGTTSFTSMIGTMTLNQYITDVMGWTAAEALAYTAIINQTIQQSFTGTITIKSDNTYTSNLGGDTDSGTWSLNSDGTKLTINSSSTGIQVIDITEITSSVLKIKLTNVFSEDVNSDGTPESITVVADITFNR